MSAHGTRTLYVAGCRCDACKDANAAYQRRLNARLRGTLAPGDPRHGNGGYTNYGCGCPVCSEAHSAEMRGNYESRKQRGLPPDDSRHGTQAAYSGWGCRCLPCQQAGVKYRAARKAVAS